jgi:hypothetical protein
MRHKRSVADAELLEPHTVGEHIEEPHPATGKALALSIPSVTKVRLDVMS